MADVSKDKLRKEITAILKNANLLKMSTKKVRQQLEKKLEVDLTDQKKVVDDLVMEFLNEKKTGGKKRKNESDEDEEDGEEENNGDAEEENDFDDEDEKDKRKSQKKNSQKNSKGSDSEEPSDDDDEEEYGPKKKAKTTIKKSGAKKKKKGSDNDSDEDWGKNKKKGGGGGRRGGGGGGGSKGGYTKPCNLSPELAQLVGKDSMPRHEVVKKIWAIIKERNLYDPQNKQYAICDDELLKVFGTKRFRAFSMMKYLKNHFLP